MQRVLRNQSMHIKLQEEGLSQVKAIRCHIFFCHTVGVVGSEAPLQSLDHQVN